MAKAERFEVELPPDLAQFVHSQVGQGTLASDGDVVREAVRFMQRQATKLADLRAMVNASIDDPRPSLSDEQVAEHLETRSTRARPREGRA